MQIFFDYQNDWSRGNLNNSRNYMTANCFKEQSKIFKKQINCFQDVVIEPEILGISISKTGFNTCTIQINAKMINILINPKSGMVIRGNQTPREFTEFWSFELISQPTKKLLLQNIQQI